MNGRPEFPWQAGYMRYIDRNKWVEHSLRREAFGVYSLTFIPAPLPQGQKGFCVYLALMESVMALVHDGNFLSARLSVL